MSKYKVSLKFKEIESHVQDVQNKYEKYSDSRCLEIPLGKSEDDIHEIKSSWGFRTNRQAIQSTTLALVMERTNCSFEDLFREDQLVEEKKKAFDDVVKAVENGSPEDRKFIAETMLKGTMNLNQAVNDYLKEVDVTQPDFMMSDTAAMLYGACETSHDLYQEIRVLSDYTIPAAKELGLKVETFDDLQPYLVTTTDTVYSTYAVNVKELISSQLKNFKDPQQSRETILEYSYAIEAMNKDLQQHGIGSKDFHYEVSELVNPIAFVSNGNSPDYEKFFDISREEYLASSMELLSGHKLKDADIVKNENGYLKANHFPDFKEKYESMMGDALVDTPMDLKYDYAFDDEHLNEEEKESVYELFRRGDKAAQEIQIDEADLGKLRMQVNDMVVAAFAAEACRKGLFISPEDTQEMVNESGLVDRFVDEHNILGINNLKESYQAGKQDEIIQVFRNPGTERARVNRFIDATYNASMANVPTVHIDGADIDTSQMSFSDLEEVEKKLADKKKADEISKLQVTKNIRERRAQIRQMLQNPSMIDTMGVQAATSLLALQLVDQMNKNEFLMQYARNLEHGFL